METTDYEHGVVPLNQRKSWLPIAAVWVAIGIDLSGAFLGIELASGMAFWPAIAATFVGSLLLGLLAMACAYVGAATGLTTAMVSRAVFGKIGGAILALAMAVSLIGWFAVQAGFFGSNARVAVLELTGIDWPVQIFTVLGGVLMTLTAIWGYRSISRLSTLAVPLLIMLLAVALVVGFISFGTAPLQDGHVSLFSFGGAVSLVMSIFVLGVVSAPDMARWARTPKQAMTAGFFGFFFGNSIIIVVAIILSKLLHESELMTIFFMLGLGGLAVVVLILAQWTTNTTNVYSAAISFSAISRRFSRRTLTIMGGIVGIVIAVLGAADWFIMFISVIGTVVAPFGGVYLATFFANRAHLRFTHAANVPNIAIVPVTAWVLGIAAALLTTSPADGLGLGWFNFTTIPALDGLVVGFVAALILELTLRRRLTVANLADGVEA